MKELIEIQSKLKAPKGQYNKFGKFYYRSCEDILEAVKPLLVENKCTLTISDDIVMLGDRFYVKATATLINSDGEEVKTVAMAREEEEKKGMDASQLTGATSSYARKYALNGMFCIDDAKDADTRDNTMSANTDMLELAKQEINGARSLSTLTSIYNNYQQLHADKTFMTLLSTRKKELSNA